VVGLLALAACTPGAAQPSKDKLKLHGVLGYELNLPSLVAVATDYFGEQNIEIEDFVLGSGATVRNAVIAKEYDFGLFAFVHVPIARSAGSPWKMLVISLGADANVLYTASRAEKSMP
jgi:ABC-type nitrate/sulfonate/bicarbonate transport system substrate-binding protein